MLWLVDASIYQFRAWQTLPAELDTRGEPHQVVAGFAGMLTSLLERARSDAVLCAWDDSGRQGLRNQLYPPYKMDRPKTPEDLQVQFAPCRQVAAAFGLPGIGSQLVEADDIIGHFAALAQQSDVPVTIVSGDKDLAQYVTSIDRYWDFGRDDPQTQKQLQQRFRIPTHRIPDWLALSGDKSDNIPGVPGVGAATAARLLRKWDNLDTLFAHLGEVADMPFRGAHRVSQLLFEHQERVRLARQLTGHLSDPALPASLAATHRESRSEADMQQSLQALHFHPDHAERLARRVSAANNS